jgi:hypothetical protein
MQLVVVIAVRKAVSAATTIFTAISIRRDFFISYPVFVRNWEGAKGYLSPLR